MEENWDLEITGQSQPNVATRPQFSQDFQPNEDSFDRKNYRGIGRGNNNWRDRSDEGNFQSRVFHAPRDRNDDRSNRGRASNRGYYPRNDRPREESRTDSSRANYGSNNNPLKMSINQRDVGRIIGKGGSKIKELQSTSQAHIQVDKNDGGDECMVIITGSDEAKTSAYDLINDLINESYAPSNRGARSSQYKSGVGGSYQSSYNAPSQSSSSQEWSAPKNEEMIDWSKAAQEYESYQKERWGKCPKLVKNFYVEDSVVTCMSYEEVAQFRKENNNISVTTMNDVKVNIPNPVRNFKEAFNHYPEILEELKKNNFVKPSPIQCQAWPILLMGLDLIGIAQTGTGKTFAFLLPALIHTDRQLTPRDQRGGPNVLILAPTRELALQLEREANKLNYKGIKSCCVYGGGNRREQIGIVERGVQIVIATPGRLNDLVMANVIDVSSITFLILDEADRMLDMGFEPQIKKILLDIRPDRQTVMTSATWPEGVRRLANQYMTNPLMVCIGSLDLAATHTVEQIIEIVQQDDKRNRLYEFTDSMSEDEKIIVFVGKKSVVDDIASDFAIKGVVCQALHGDREQSDREQALDDLKVGNVKVLIATDVASRGLDIKDITHIINYDFPRNIEDYVHRVGRTGRAGRTGKAITFFTREDWSHAKELIDILVESSQHVPEELYAMAERFEIAREKREKFGSRGGGGRGRRGQRF